MKLKYRHAVFVVVYAKNKGKIEYLTLKRKLHWTGWEFPKGGSNKFETKKRAVRREVKEETGFKPVKIQKFDFSGKFKYDRDLKDRPGIIGQDFYLYAAEIKRPPKGKIILDKLEHSDYEWLAYNEAMKKLTWENQRKSLKIVNKWVTGRK